jgi:hypothetical protein
MKFMSEKQMFGPTREPGSYRSSQLVAGGGEMDIPPDHSRTQSLLCNSAGSTFRANLATL